MRILTLSLLLLLAGCTAPPRRSDVPADINAKYLDPEMKVVDWERRFEVESREIYSERKAIAAAVGLRPGDVVADVGAGTGLFVAPFSRAVGARGKVLALDIAQGFVDHVAARARAERLSNVSSRLSAQDSLGLPPASVDVVFVCDTYHHFEYHRAMLASIRSALRPGGRLVVIDFERIPGTSRDWVLGHVRAGKEQVTREITAAGFRLLEEVGIPGLEENYFLRFTRP